MKYKAQISVMPMIYVCNMTRTNIRDHWSRYLLSDKTICLRTRWSILGSDCITSNILLLWFLKEHSIITEIDHLNYPKPQITTFSWPRSPTSAHLDHHLQLTSWAPVGAKNNFVQFTQCMNVKYSKIMHCLCLFCTFRRGFVNLWLIYHPTNFHAMSAMYILYTV